ncbi:MAG: helix-turn-helix domain-containing protein [Prevotella sp.]|jgi:transcriptional regulator with XRE-family HTH domain|nr:helix-turn-helix domain-containing protein [Prevotella sp.]
MQCNKQYINRIKVVLAEKRLTNKWLAEKLGKNPTTVSKWCTNSSQPQLETFLQIAQCLGVTLNDLVSTEEKPTTEALG